MIRERRQPFMIFLAALAATILCVPAVGAAPSDPVLSIEPATVEVRPGAGFSVQVMVEGAKDLGGFQMEFAYDPSVVEVRKVTVGDFLTSSGRNRIPLPTEVNNEEGVAAFAAASFGDSPGADGSGVLATIACTGRAQGSSALVLQNVSMMDTAAGVIAVEMEEGQVVVDEMAAQSNARRRNVRWALIAAAAVVGAAGVAVLAIGMLRQRSEREANPDAT